MYIKLFKHYNRGIFVDDGNSTVTVSDIANGCTAVFKNGTGQIVRDNVIDGKVGITADFFVQPYSASFRKGDESWSVTQSKDNEIYDCIDAIKEELNTLKDSVSAVIGAVKYIKPLRDEMVRLDKGNEDITKKQTLIIGQLGEIVNAYNAIQNDIKAIKEEQSL